VASPVAPAPQPGAGVTCSLVMVPGRGATSGVPEHVSRVAEVLALRRTQTNEPGRCAVPRLCARVTRAGATESGSAEYRNEQMSRYTARIDDGGHPATTRVPRGLRATLASRLEQTQLRHPATA
jgi:hypothetical protein